MLTEQPAPPGLTRPYSDGHGSRHLEPGGVLAWVPRLPAALAARRRARRRHRHGVPHPAGDGVRRARRPAAGHRALGRPSARLVAYALLGTSPPAVGRTRVDDGADDGRGAGLGRRRPARSTPRWPSRWRCGRLGALRAGQVRRPRAALADLLSRPVLVGYMAGVACIMVVSQLGKLTGMTVEGDGFAQEIWYVLGHLVRRACRPRWCSGSARPRLMMLGSHCWPRAPDRADRHARRHRRGGGLRPADEGVKLIGDIPSGAAALHRLPRSAGASVAACWFRRWGWRSWRTPTTSSPPAPSRSVPIRSTRPRELLALGAANLGAGLMQGLPGQQQRQPDGDRGAVGARSQLAGLVTVLGHGAGGALPAARAGRLPRAAPGRGRRVRRDPAGRRTRVPPARPASAPASWSWPWARPRRSSWWACCRASLVAIALSLADLLRRVSDPTTRSRASSPTWPACTTSTTTRRPRCSRA